MSTPSSAQAPEHSRVVVNHEELVTIAVPARNEERFIGHCLDSLSGQTHRNVEILVVDSASTDGTREVVLGRARDDGRIRLLSYPGASIPGALNAALAAARGKWFVRVDAHATVPEDYVSGLVRHLGTGRSGDRRSDEFPIRRGQLLVSPRDIEPSRRAHPVRRLSDVAPPKRERMGRN